MTATFQIVITGKDSPPCWNATLTIGEIRVCAKGYTKREACDRVWSEYNALPIFERKKAEGA